MTRTLAILTLVGCATDPAIEDAASRQLSRDCFIPICLAATATSLAVTDTSPDLALVDGLLAAAGTRDCAVAADRLLDIDEIPYALRRRGITSLDAIGCFSHFTRLNFYSNDITDVTPLAGMHALESLSLASNHGIESLAPLADLALERLFVRYLPVHDLDSLAASRGTLRYLDVTGATTISEDQIARFRELRTLVAQRRPLEVAALAPLSKLTTLDLEFSEGIVAAPGAFPRSLHKLDLMFTDVTDAAVLAPLTALTDLDVSYTELAGWPALAGLTKMQRFAASHTSAGTIEFAAGWTQLETIDASSAGLSAADALAGKPHLATVNLGSNAIASPPDLTASPLLESLFLDDNQLHDVSALVPLSWVRMLYIGHNPVEAGLCELARTRPDRPAILPHFQTSPGFDPVMDHAIDACP